MTHTVYRIRRNDTGQFYSGGTYGNWCMVGAGGATYETAAACKCVWSMAKRYGFKLHPIPDGATVDIVEYSVIETPGKAEALK